MITKQSKWIYFLAAIVVAGSLILKFFKINGSVDLVLISVVAFFFGLNTPKPQDV